MNPAEFMRRWIKGIKDITPAQQLNAQMLGFAGGAVGLALALGVFIYRLIFIRFDLLQLGFAIFVLFLIWMQIIQFIGTRQKCKGLVKMMGDLNEKEHPTKNK